jgi:hypothetical protein
MAIHVVTPWDSHENAVSMEESIRIWRSPVRRLQNMLNPLVESNLNSQVFRDCVRNPATVALQQQI